MIFHEFLNQSNFNVIVFSQLLLSLDVARGFWGHCAGVSTVFPCAVKHPTNREKEDENWKEHDD